VLEYDVQADHVELQYEIVLGSVKAKVRTSIQFRGDFELRRHNIEASGAGLAEVEVIEGGAAYSETAVYPDAQIKSWALRGWKSNKTEDGAGSVFWAKTKIQMLAAPLEPTLLLASYRYQSPKALPKEKIDEEARLALSSFRP